MIMRFLVFVILGSVWRIMCSVETPEKSSVIMKNFAQAESLIFATNSTVLEEKREKLHDDSIFQSSNSRVVTDQDSHKKDKKSIKRYLRDHASTESNVTLLTKTHTTEGHLETAPTITTQAQSGSNQPQSREMNDLQQNPVVQKESPNNVKSKANLTPYIEDPSAHTFVLQMKKDIFSNTIIKKTVFHEKKRVLFVAGLEGSGHHAMRAMFTICFQENLCAADQDITHDVMWYDPVPRVIHGLFSAEDGDKVADQVKRVYTDFKRVAKSNMEKLIIVGLSFTPKSAMQSYPNYNGKNKAMDHPDIAMMAYIAEAAGVDFRVLVLQRGAAEILASTEAREMGGKYEEKVLVTNAEALYTQILLIDHSFYHCIQYTQLGSLSTQDKQDFSDFINPNVLKQSLLDKMLKEIHYSKPKVDNSSHEMEFTNNHYHIYQLQKRLSLIDGLCTKVPNRSTILL